MAAEGLDEFIQAMAEVGFLSGPIRATGAAFTSLAQKLVPFVEAFAPGAVLAFNQAMRDTSAVVGSALLPVLNVMTGIVRHVGDALIPVAQKLAPILQTLADTVGKIIGVWVNTFASVLGAFADAIRPLMPIFEGLGSLLQAWGVIVGGLLGGFMKMWTNLMGVPADGANKLKDAFQSLAKAAVLAVGALAKFAGADSILKGMINALGGEVKKGGSTGFAVPTNVQIQDAMSFNRDLAIRAFSAQGAPDPSDEEEWRKEALEELQKLNAGQTTTWETLKQSFASLERTGKELTEALKALKGTSDVVKQGSQIVEDNWLDVAIQSLGLPGLLIQADRGRFTRKVVPDEG